MTKTNILLFIFVFNYLTVNILAQETGSKSDHTSSVSSVVFSPDGKQIVSGSYEDKNIKIWDVATGREIRNIYSDINGVNNLKISPDGKQIISSSFDLPGIIKIWDINTGKELRTILNSSNGPIESMDLSLDGRQIVVVYDEFYDDKDDIKRICFFDANTGKLIRAIFTKDASKIAFNPDGKRIATSHPNNEKIRIWDSVTRKVILTISEDVGWVNFLFFSPDGNHIISSATSKETYKPIFTIWDANTGKKKIILSTKPEQYSPIAISPDGNLIAFVSDKKKTIGLFNITADKEINTVSDFSGHTDKIKSLAFSPDGKMIVSGSTDKSVKLWDVATGKEIRTMGK
jgi:WD40 repeat protein